jgi:hypothetical protein
VSSTPDGADGVDDDPGDDTGAGDPGVDDSVMTASWLRSTSL